MFRDWLGTALPEGGRATSFPSLVSPYSILSSPLKLVFISIVEFSQFHFSYFLPTVRSCCRECQQLLAGVRCWLEEEALYLAQCLLCIKGEKNKSNFSVCIYCNYPELQPLLQAEQHLPGISLPSSRILQCPILHSFRSTLPTSVPIRKP